MGISAGNLSIAFCENLQLDKLDKTKQNKTKRGDIN